MSATPITISVGGSRWASSWESQTLSWGDFILTLKGPDETQLRHRDPRGVHGPAQG